MSDNENLPVAQDPNGANSSKEPNSTLQVVAGLALAGWAIAGDQGWIWFPRLVESKKLNFVIVLLPLAIVFLGAAALFKRMFSGGDQS